MFKMKKTPARALTYEQALSRATRLCSGSEHGRHEMEEKACLWGLTALEARRLADYLEAERYVDDARFCRAYVHDKLHYNHWGPAKIGQMLRMQGIDDALASEALGEVEEEEWHTVLLNVLQQKMRTMPAQDPYATRTKLIRHALSRGFMLHEIERALQES